MNKNDLVYEVSIKVSDMSELPANTFYEIAHSGGNLDWVLSQINKMKDEFVRNHKQKEQKYMEMINDTNNTRAVD